MTNLRQAAQQAIEAIGTIRKLINMHGEFWLVDALKCHEAADALRKALAEPERKPLTDEEIVRLMVGEDRVQLLYSKPGDPYFSEFAEGAIRELVESGRAIERAHGIGAQNGS